MTCPFLDIYFYLSFELWWGWYPKDIFGNRKNWRRYLNIIEDYRLKLYLINI